jgi:RNA polymerase sigma factor (sigma-70 family)
VVRREPTDRELIVASRENPKMFIALFDRHFDSVHRYLRRRVGKDIADDLAAQTFTEAFGDRAAFDLTAESARPWLFGIAINLLRHHYRDEQRELRAFERTGVDPIGSDPSVSASRLSGEVAGALAELASRERDVLLLFAWADLSYEEIAVALRVPVGTVRSRLNRARRQLQRRLGPIAAVPSDRDAAERRIVDG